ncbi:MAG: hypothetical protein WC787_04045 [Patescibacteria group bacterium]|jgi:hypothetical protein
MGKRHRGSVTDHLARNATIAIIGFIVVGFIIESWLLGIIVPVIYLCVYQALIWMHPHASNEDIRPRRTPLSRKDRT